MYIEGGIKITVMNVIGELQLGGVENLLLTLVQNIERGKFILRFYRLKVRGYFGDRLIARRIPDKLRLLSERIVTPKLGGTKCSDANDSYLCCALRIFETRILKGLLRYESFYT